MFGIEVKTLQKYEDGSRTPSGTTAKYLSMIEKIDLRCDTRPDPEARPRGRRDRKGSGDALRIGDAHPKTGETVTAILGHSSCTGM